MGEYITIKDFMLEIRNLLAGAKDQNNTDLLRRLGLMLATLEEIAERHGDKVTAHIALEMYETIRDIATGATWKYDLITVEEIEEKYR